MTKQSNLQRQMDDYADMVGPIPAYLPEEVVFSRNQIRNAFGAGYNVCAAEVAGEEIGIEVDPEEWPT